MLKNKNKIRIIAMLIIFTFVLIPILSSNVSALVGWNAGNGTTNNTPAGPTAVGVMTPPPPNPPGLVDPAPTPQATVIFNFGYTFTDTNNLGAGSWHTVSMTVAPALGGVAPVSTTGPIFLNPGAILVGTHFSPAYTSPRGTTYTITVTLTCIDAIVGPPGAVWTGVTTCTVN
jgi:hypothetical protein